MSNHNSSSSSGLGAFSQGILELADVSLDSLKKMVNGNKSNIEQAGQILGRMGVPGLGNSDDDCGCCPPRNACPPNCIMELRREAYEGERIKVLFSVKNKHKINKTYRIGVRPLKAENGVIPANQPILNVTNIVLAPGTSQMVAMTIDLNQYLAGHSYKTDIVIQETGSNINQNICFTLFVKSYENIPEAQPRDVLKPVKHFKDWQTHFYCTPQKQATAGH